ncbi:CBS domain-containing protein [Candidatus Pacearchaeota archaeon]|nr:CBS domain-containing protein [Candidatus Pacearchaeota archaeon]
MKSIVVADIMTREPETIKPDTNLLECAKKMVKKKVGSLLIVDGKKLVGFISRQDVLWALVKKSKEDLSSIKAIDISPKKIATIKPSASINEVLSKMKKLKFDRLPVIQEKELVGMLTIKDILNFNPGYYPELDEFAQIREETQKLKRVNKSKKRIINEGVCSECGNHDILFRENGMLICPSCAETM